MDTVQSKKQTNYTELILHQTNLFVCLTLCEDVQPNTKIHPKQFAQGIRINLQLSCLFFVIGYANSNLLTYSK